MPQQQEQQGRIVVEDGELLMWIIEGKTSAYTIHAAMKERFKTNENRRKIAYSNVAERLLGLAKAGLIEETKIGKPSIHGRKDYKVTSDGMRKLIPYILTHSQELLPTYIAPLITEYMDKYIDKDDWDKQDFGYSIFNEYIWITIFLKEYLKHIDLSTRVVANIPVDVIQPGTWNNVMSEMVEIIVSTEKRNYPTLELTTRSKKAIPTANAEEQMTLKQKASKSRSKH